MGGNIVTNVIGPLAASFLSSMNAKSAHAHLLHSVMPCEKMAVTDAVSSTCCHWISCEKG